MTTDTIIPVYNEEKLLADREDYYRDLRKHTRLIFVDGGSTDQTVDVAKQFGDVFVSSRGRALQMNEGARQSKAENFLFLHADTYIEGQAIQQIEEAFVQNIGYGGFTMQIRDSRFLFRVFEWIVNFRGKYFFVMDGDLGLFIKRNLFDEINGFDEVSVMEDIYISKKLRKKAKSILLPNKIQVSSREWYRQGFFKTFLRYFRNYFRFWMRKPALNV